LAVGEDVGEGGVLEEAEGVVGGEAGFAFGVGEGVPGAGGGRGGEAAEEAGELAGGAEGGVLFFEEILNESEVFAGEFEWGMGSAECGIWRGRLRL